MEDISVFFFGVLDQVLDIVDIEIEEGSSVGCLWLYFRWGRKLAKGGFIYTLAMHVLSHQQMREVVPITPITGSRCNYFNYFV